MKKALIIANMLFASATVWGMVPHDHNENFGNKKKFSLVEESSEEDQQPRKKSRNLRKQMTTMWNVRDSEIFGLSNISDERLLPFRRSVLNLKPYITTPICRKYNEELQLMSSIRFNTRKIDKTNRDILQLGGNFSNLTELSTDASTLMNISLDSLSFPALETLIIGGEKADEPDAVTKIGQLMSKCSETLKKFDVSNTDVDTLPPEIVNCKNLEYLNISDSSMMDIPDMVFELAKLKHLEFQLTYDMYDIMERLSPKISNLTNLEFLAIVGEYALKTLPPQIGHLKKLKTLIVSGNGLTSLPKEIEKLENLNHLDVAGNDLETLPAGLGKLKNLDILEIVHNERLDTIPLEILNSFKNRLKETNKELTKLTLRYLLVYKNREVISEAELAEFVKQISEEEKMLKERESNLKSSLAVLRFYSDSDDESVSGSESDSESTNGLSDSDDESVSGSESDSASTNGLSEE